MASDAWSANRDRRYERAALGGPRVAARWWGAADLDRRLRRLWQSDSGLRRGLKSFRTLPLSTGLAVPRRADWAQGGRLGVRTWVDSCAVGLRAFHYGRWAPHRRPPGLVPRGAYTSAPGVGRRRWSRRYGGPWLGVSVGRRRAGPALRMGAARLARGRITPAWRQCARPTAGPASTGPYGIDVNERSERAAADTAR